MKAIITSIFSVFLFPALSFSSDTQWELAGSKTQYKVTYTLKSVVGKSDSAKGKGVCKGGKCQFLVAIPVKDFDSGDRNRDLHMMEVTKAAVHPLVKFMVTIPESKLGQNFTSDVELEFAGIKKVMANVPFKINLQGNTAQVDSEFTIKLEDFSVERPKLLTIPVNNEVPISVHAEWTKKI